MVYCAIKRLVIFFILLMAGYAAVSQLSEDSRKVVQISGIVLNNTDLEPIPYVNVSVKGTLRGTSADIHGFFSLVTYAGDLLMFSSV
ncbi:MAG: carboxypeptidase-like regulatory domain-containing protein, partial [Bacteroidales bacterium]|nr:carboxypeptidase-like regulatory domain-containing protein [Bacteroidales bacterium]